MNKKLISIFVILLIGLVSATNISIMYGQNSSGGFVPMQVDSDGRLKTNMNFVNVTASAFSISENFTLGSGIIMWNASTASYIYYNGTAWKEIGTITNAGTAPTNSVVAFNQASCPTGWQLADGTSGTPDLRGIFIRGAGTSGIMQMANGTNFSATYGEYQNDSMQGHRHQVYREYGWAAGTEYLGVSPNVGTDFNVILDPITDGTNGVPRTGAETRPASYALIYCVKTATEDTSSSVFKLVGNVVSLFNSNNSLSIATNVSIGNGTIWYNDSDEKFYYYNKTAWLDIGSGSGTGEAVIKSYTEVNHTLSVGNAVYYNGSRHLKAISNDSNKLGTGIISRVSGDGFDVTYSGYISGLSGLTAGSFYYVSETQEGNLSTSQGSNFSNPLLQAMSATTGVVFNWRASEIDTDPIIQYWRNESGVVTSNESVLIRGNLNVTGNITGGSPVKILGGLQVHNSSGDISFTINDSTGVVRVHGNLNVSGDIFGNYTAENRQYVYNGSDWLGARSTAEGVQQIFLNDSSRKYDAIPTNAVMSFNQASCPAGWSLADGTSGTPDLSNLGLAPKNTSRVRVTKNDTQTFATATTTKIQYDDEVYDTLNEYNSSYSFVAKNAGYYDVKAAVFFGEYAWTVGQVIELYIFKNGGILYSILNAERIEYTGTSQRYLSGSDMVYLDVGDYLEIKLYHSRGADTDTAGSYNYFSVDYLGQTPTENTGLIYCMKTAEDSEVSNSIWNIVGNIVKLVNTTQTLEVGNLNVTGNFVALKQYYGNSSSGPGSFNVTGTNWLTHRAVAIPYQTSDGAWRMRFNIAGTFGATTSDTYALTISGVTFKNLANFEQAIAHHENDNQGRSTEQYASAFVSPNSGAIIVYYASSFNFAGRKALSGDVELDSKPTWAD